MKVSKLRIKMKPLSLILKKMQRTTLSSTKANFKETFIIHGKMNAIVCL